MILWHDNIAESQIIKKWGMKFPNKCLDFDSFRHFLYQFSQFYYNQFGRDKSKIISPLDNKIQKDQPLKSTHLNLVSIQNPQCLRILAIFIPY